MPDSLGFETWIAPRHLTDGWLPSMFEPRVMDLLSAMERSGRELVRVNEFCELAQATHGEFNPVSCRWIVDLREIRRSRISDFDSKSQQLKMLPSEAVLVGRIVSSAPAVRYWNDNVFQGAACFDASKFVALTTKSIGSVAWLSEALNSEHAIAQITRQARGSTIPFVAQEQVMGLIVPVPSKDEDELLASVALRKAEAAAESIRTGRLKKSVLLSGQTLEERLTQFEQFVIDEGAFAPQSFIYIEPANQNNQTSDLFVASSRIPTDQKRLADCSFRAIEDAEIAKAWRDWFWDDTNQEDYRIFNSLVGGSELPGYVITQSFLPTNHSELFPHEDHKRFIPSFSLYRETIKGLGHEFSESQLANDWSEIWASVNKLDAETIRSSLDSDLSGWFVDNVLNWAQQVYRPALAVKVRKDGRPIGAYIFFGEADIRMTEESFEALDDFGFQFSEILMPTSESVESATRRESLRRLSWLMHQLNGPVGRAKLAFKDLEEFLSHNSEIAASLVPTEAKARGRAEMQNPDSPSIQEHTFSARLQAAMKAVMDIRSVSYQIKRLKRVQGELVKAPFDMESLLRQIAAGARTRMQDIDVSIHVESKLSAFGEEQSIREALEEVVNNACRELEVRKTTAPSIQLVAIAEAHRVLIKITDNALPIEESIAVDDPFKEDSSSYVQDSKGSGLGLTIVRDTFRAHRGLCKLEENMLDGKRVSGVTFVATMETEK